MDKQRICSLPHAPLIYCWLCLASRASGTIVFSRAARPAARRGYTYGRGIPVCLVKFIKIE